MKNVSCKKVNINIYDINNENPKYPYRFFKLSMSVYFLYHKGILYHTSVKTAKNPINQNNVNMCKRYLTLFLSHSQTFRKANVVNLKKCSNMSLFFNIYPTLKNFAISYFCQVIK